jgi:cellulose synthase/poly-beta-1,6-N-acetylglucosamine synthase-like glycosyltransferase
MSPLNTMVWIGSIALSALQVLVLLGTSYYYLLLLASVPKRKIGELERRPQKTFAIAIPAHNEEAVLAETLLSLKAQTYPANLFDVYVVADHCDDHTARVARQNGAVCYEQNEGPHGRKAYALQWLLSRILSSGRDYDALVVFDADSRVEQNFLHSMNVALCQGHQVLQGQHVIINPRESRFSALAGVDMRLNNLLRNRARRNLGLSSRLMGDAMCFASDIIRQRGWQADSLGEDREYGLYLLTQGIKTFYVAEALSFGQAAPGWKDASRQRLRWYGGVLHIQKQFALKLLGLGLRRVDLAALDQAFELLLPPISVLALLSALIVLAQAAWPGPDPLIPFPVSVGVLLAWIVFPFLGLLADGAPASEYQAIVYGPFYLLWRLYLEFKARVRGGRVEWVRTRRSQET